ncbi:hypothetical protein AVEN_89564-1 [Araneus ventricosus]|uniref:Uncharacterized protein n=1 Tax=Araneus ventricosus TaxID=182803 RepID=A0A4Y2GUI0_ARAVE|nr:hypothetical protein AVEN_89564-1 [Araneus ventricosus]
MHSKQHNAHLNFHDVWGPLTLIPNRDRSVPFRSLPEVTGRCTCQLSRLQMPVAEQNGPKCKTGHLPKDGILHFLFQKRENTFSRPEAIPDDGSSVGFSPTLRPDSAATAISSAISFFPVPGFNDAVSGILKRKERVN